VYSAVTPGDAFSAKIEFIFRVSKIKFWNISLFFSESEVFQSVNKWKSFISNEMTTEMLKYIRDYSKVLSLRLL